MTLSPLRPTNAGRTKPCSRKPRPSATAPMIIAKLSPTSWMIGLPRKPPAEASRPSRIAVAAQWTRQSPDRPIASRSRRLVAIALLAMTPAHIAHCRWRYNISSVQKLRPCRAQRSGRRALRPMSAAAASNAADTAASPSPVALSNLLLAVAGLVFAMLVVGGITRLTESGLSITQWNVVSGVVPPLTHADWVRAFALYQQTPQYRQVAAPAGMTLAGFKLIFFWEWAHRLLGRIIGLVFFLGVGWFALRREIPRRYAWRLAALFVLGGLQGAVGWLMVASGLEGRTEVSPYRLSAHLLFALFLMGALLWTALDLRRLARDPRTKPARLTGWTALALAVLF